MFVRETDFNAAEPSFNQAQLFDSHLTTSDCWVVTLGQLEGLHSNFCLNHRENAAALKKPSRSAISGKVFWLASIPDTYSIRTSLRTDENV